MLKSVNKSSPNNVISLQLTIKRKQKEALRKRIYAATEANDWLSVTKLCHEIKQLDK